MRKTTCIMGLKRREGDEGKKDVWRCRIGGGGWREEKKTRTRCVTKWKTLAGSMDLID